MSQPGINIIAFRRDQMATRQNILDAFGIDAIDQERINLCANCKHADRPCSLLPLTTTGEPCPYHEPKKLAPVS